MQMNYKKILDDAVKIKIVVKFFSFDFLQKISKQAL